jgi:SAM-dependent methyltransferase
MKRDLLELLCCPDCKGDLRLNEVTPAAAEVESGALDCPACDVSFPIVRGVPRFVDSDQYAGSFSYEWNRWDTVQLDAVNGSRESEETFAEKTAFQPHELRGRLMLDVGCGAGRFLDVASRWGARVVGVDLSFAVEAAQRNVGSRPDVSVIQADVFRLPFRDETFDAIFSIGVLHHSRDTRLAFLQLPRLLKRGGDIAVWLYYYQDWLYSRASDFWRAVWRPFPTWVVYAWCWLLVTLFSERWATDNAPGVRHGYLRRLLPVSLHADRKWRLLDTFDWYTPRFQDKTCSPARVLRWCEEGGIRDVRVLDTLTSVRGTRVMRDGMPLVRWSIPNLRLARVVVFGAGAAGQSALHLLRRIAPGCVVAVADNDPAKHGRVFEGLPVVSLDSLPREDYDVVIIASLPGRQAIAAQLDAKGLIAGVGYLGMDEVVSWRDLIGDEDLLAA